MVAVTRATTIVGVPIDSVGVAGGTELGPRALREQRIVEALAARDAGDLDVRVIGTDRDPDSGVVGFGSVTRTTEVLRSSTAGLASAGDRLLVLGGCCTMAVGIAAGPASESVSIPGNSPSEMPGRPSGLNMSMTTLRRVTLPPGVPSGGHESGHGRRSTALPFASTPITLAPGASSSGSAYERAKLPSGPKTLSVRCV